MNNKNKLIKARVTEDEEILIKAKAEYYGYKTLSKYLIDAAIYEKVTNVNLLNEDKIYNAYAENTKELKKITREIRSITKYSTQLDSISLKELKSLMFTVIKNQKEMLKMIDTKLDFQVWQEINHIKTHKED